MNEKEFKKGFKIFKRFLKENNAYASVMGFLFKNGRKPIHLFYEFNSKRFDDVNTWKMVLQCTNLMVGKGNGTYDKTNFFSKLDSVHYQKAVGEKNLNHIWKDYYEKHRSEFKVEKNMKNNGNNIAVDPNGKI